MAQRNQKPDQEEKAKPVFSVRVYSNGGFIEGATFQSEKEGDNGTFTTFGTTFKRTYKDAKGNWATMHTFGEADLLALSWCAQELFAQITRERARK